MRLRELLTTHYSLRVAREGQSLIELLVSIGVGVILIVGAVSVISTTIKTQGDTTHLQVAAGLGKQLLDNVRVSAEGNWHIIDSLSTSSLNRYYLITSSSPYTVATGTQSIALTTTTYTRYFYLDDVCRNSSSKIDVCGTTLDPSTKKVTVVYGWGNVTNSIFSYLVRANNSVFTQTDWSGGPNQVGVVTPTTVNTKFSTSSNINYTTSTASPTSTTGSLVVQGF
jgi:hypothetical protein